MKIDTTAIAVGDMVFDVSVAGDPAAEMVLFLHGFPQTNHSWRHQLPYLSDRGYYCVAPNQRGYSAGARPAAIADYATSLLVDDMLGLIRASGHDRAHVVGHDWGGQVSWLLAALHPDLVQTLSVLSRPHPAAFAAAMKVDSAQADRSRHHRAFQDEDTARQWLADDASQFRNALSGQGVPTDDIDAYLAVLGQVDALNAAVNWYRSRADGSALAGASVPEVVVPTLYLWGTNDATVGREAATTTRAHVNAPYRFVEIPDVGHFITDQVSDVVNREIHAHISLKHEGAGHGR